VKKMSGEEDEWIRMRGGGGGVGPASDFFTPASDRSITESSSFAGTDPLIKSWKVGIVVLVSPQPYRRIALF
jgi:hypothetical protein